MKLALTFLSLAFIHTASARASEDGLIFDCATNNLLKEDVVQYLHELKISPKLYDIHETENGTLRFVLTTPESDTTTLNFHARPEYALTTETIYLPTATGTRAVAVTSKKEIMLALMQHGRRTVFDNHACTLHALKDHIGVRQNIVAWTTKLSWVWPDGGYAKWNTQYWNKGTPVDKKSLARGLLDMFIHQDWYSIGCYTATKVAMTHGIYDYYTRVQHRPRTKRILDRRLWSDGDPLKNIEPAKMWHFESDFDHATINNKGKILTLHENVAKNNFVPGDWTYILNTDPQSYKKIGYEGSNAIYLGQNKFDDYYNDHQSFYLYEQKLNEVYQWRNGVFSRSRDAKKIKPLTPQEIESLKNPPEQGGLQLTYRAYPYIHYD